MQNIRFCLLHFIHAQAGGRMGGGKFSTRKIFKKFLGGWKIFPFRFLVNFDVFLVDFDAKIHMRGENLPKIPNGGWKITTRTTPQTGGEKILGIF